MNGRFRIGSELARCIKEQRIPLSSLLRHAGLPAGFFQQEKVMASTAELFAMRRSGSDLPEIDRTDRAVLLAHHHEATTTDVASPRCHHGQCPMHGDGGINGAAAVAQHLHTHGGGQWMSAHDHGTIG